MTYRIDPIEIPETDPYKNDVLQRKRVVEFLAGLIQRAGGPFVLALDSPYGTGKTTLVNMLRAVLTQQTFQCIYFNAWQLDYVTDPLVAMVSAVDQIARNDESKYAGMKVQLGRLRQVTTAVVKRGGVAAVKVATLGALDIAEEIETVAADLAADTTSDIVEAFQQESEQLSKFRQELKAVVAELPAAGKKETLVFFVDELDRCRPTFAIELLERIKHLFDVPNIVFILSVDKRQLEASIAAVYGNGINAPEYLRRFIDLEYGIPEIHGEAFTELLLKRFALDDLFAARQGREVAYDRQQFVEFFSKLADLHQMSLRTRERCITRMKVVLEQTPSNHYLDPVHVALLIVLRTKQPDLYARLVRGLAFSDDVMAHLKELPAGVDFVLSRQGIYLEALLMHSERDGTLVNAKKVKINELSSDETLHPDERERYKQLSYMLSNWSWGMRISGPSLDAIAAKIDIADGIRS